jgi:predicted transcriptional regulator
LDLLRELRSDTASPRDIAHEYNVSYPTVYRALEPLFDHRLVAESGSGYHPTGLGSAIQYWIDEHLDGSRANPTDLQFLLRATHRVSILRTLHTGVARKADLSRGSDTPSRSTAHRTVQSFLERGWVTRDETTHFISLTETGMEVLETLEAVTTTVEHARQRASFLGCFDNTIADIPLAPLTEARQITYDPVMPHRFHELLEPYAGSDVPRLRLLVSVLSASLLRVFDPVIQSGAPVEFIVTQRVLASLSSEGRRGERIRRRLQRENCSMGFVPRFSPFSLWLALFGRETVVMSPAHAGEAPLAVVDGTRAAIVSSDERLVEWAMDRYETYSDRSRRLIH